MAGGGSEGISFQEAFGGGNPAQNYMTRSDFDAWAAKQQPLNQSAPTSTAQVYTPSYCSAPAQAAPKQQQFSPMQSWSIPQDAGYGMRQSPFGFMGGYGGGYGMQTPFIGYGMGYSQPMSYGGYGMGYGQQSPFGYGQSMGGFGGFGGGFGGGYGMQTPFSGYRQPMFGGYQSYGRPMFGQFGSF